MDVTDIQTWLLHTIVELSEKRLTSDRINPTNHMLDSGYIDSLSAVVVLAEIEERWAVEVDEACLIGEAGTLQGLAAFIHNRRRS